ncbi:MAG: hypothetical protein F6K40_39840, partial [Okeania sp. SIO3I5]|uniref:hypothetical protein n=1 Tax=Okeania sp. SIO3I5 TaxID=2607805 RepID=UPI0013B605EF
PEVHTWGWAVTNPNENVIKSAFDEVIKRLVALGWNKGDNVLVKNLNAKINTIASRSNLPTHISIAIDDVWNSVKTSITKNDNSLDKAVENISSVLYHITIEVGDDLYDKDNPRWFSDKTMWSKLPSETDRYEVAQVVEEADKIISAMAKLK